MSWTDHGPIMNVKDVKWAKADAWASHAIEKNGKKIALIGAGPASLTVANDLMPLGYQCTIFERQPRPGGLMRINIPAFRLPEQVLDEEIAYIVDMGVEVKYNAPVNSLKELLDTGGYDAVFVGTGAPKGKELDVPGRHDTDQIFVGIRWACTEPDADLHVAPPLPQFG